MVQNEINGMEECMRPDDPLHRTGLLIGLDALERLARSRVILFGAGGVGSWCAEALIRSGVGHLTIVDPDVVCPSNINRQIQALDGTTGQAKCKVLGERLRSIRPDADVDARQLAYNPDTRAEFDLPSYDAVIDAIDTLAFKTDLIATAMEHGCTLFSSMGAACKLDAGQVRSGSIWKTRGCRLARFVRKRLRRRGVRGDCLCVYSPEPALRPRGEVSDPDSGVKGSIVHVTGTFGFHLAGLVIQHLIG